LWQEKKNAGFVRVVGQYSVFTEIFVYIAKQKEVNNNNTPKKAANLIISLLDHLNIKKVIVYAVSSGRLTSIEMAGNYPDRVEKLILASALTKRWLDKNGQVYKMAKKYLIRKPKKY